MAAPSPEQVARDLFDLMFVPRFTFESYSKAVMKYWAPDIQGAFPPQAKTREEFLQLVGSSFFAAFTGLSGKVLDIVAQGNKAVVLREVSGTQTGDFFDIPATGKRVTFQAIEILRVVDGKVVEARQVQDNFSLFAQLGKFPALG